MDNSGRPKMEVPVLSQSESQAHINAPAPEGENAKDDPRQTKDEPVNKARGEPIQGFAVDRKVLEAVAIGLPKEATVWDVYNDEAKKADDELVKDWRDNLGSLLLFAAIFAAVLTAFIIESKNMLEQDQTELLVNVTIFSINNMGNVSNLPFVPPTFVPSSAAISINCFLFASLGTSLVAALAAVISLQWIADYDAVTTRGGSSPEDRARRRQFRFAGVLKWNMGGIIASLPLLLYSSVALFWAGAIQWMWMLHSTVGCVVAGSTAVAVLFYASTTLLSAVFVSAPFKTPFSRAIYWVYQCTIYLVCELFSSHQARATYCQREDRAVAEDLSLTQQALAWLADQITSSANSKIRLQLLVDEVVKQFPKARFSDIQSSNAPSSETTLSDNTSWLKIFDTLSWHYLRKILDGTLSENDHDTVGVLLRRSRSPGIWDIISKKGDSEGDLIQPDDWRQYSFDTTKVAKSQAMVSVNMAFLLARDIPIPSPGSGHELRLTIRLIKWHNSGVREKKYPQAHSGIYSSEYLRSYVHYLKRFLRFADDEYYDPDDYIPLWSLSKDEGVRHELLVELLEDFDHSVAEDNSGKKHSALVGIIIKDIIRSYGLWPVSPQFPGNLSRRLAKIQDPCLALLGNIAAGAPTQHGITLLTRYLEVHSDSLDLLLFQNPSSNDPPALWRLRAFLWPAAPRSRERICSMALKHAEYMSYLQRIFEHSVSCPGHSSGPQHPLYHLCVDSGRLARFPVQTTLFTDDAFDEYWVSSILALLASPEDQYFSNIMPFSEVPAEYIERIGAMCQAATEEPTSRLALLTDIAQSSSFNYYYAANVAAILEATQLTLLIADHGTFAHLLRPLAYAMRNLSKNMLTEQRVDVTEDEKRGVAAQADRICGILEIKGATRFISSSFQLLSISCARQCVTGQAAVGWMAIHTEG